MTIDRKALIKVLQESLSDTDTGPLSDTPYTGAEVEDDGSLSLFEGNMDKNWPSAGIDIQQLANDIIRGLEAS